MVPPLVCYEPFSHDVGSWFSVSSNVGKFTAFAGTKVAAFPPPPYHPP